MVKIGINFKTYASKQDYKQNTLHGINKMI